MPRGHYGRRLIDAPGAPYGHALARTHHVGGELFHSPEDRQMAIREISADFQALYAEILRSQHDQRDPARAQAFAQWIELDVVPTIESWNAFTARGQSWWVRAATSWQTFTEWRDRVRDLRQLARAHGIVLESPEPKPLPMTVWEESEGGMGSAAAPWLGLGKLVIGAAIAATGAITVYTVVSDYAKLRRGRKHRKGT